MKKIFVIMLAASLCFVACKNQPKEAEQAAVEATEEVCQKAEGEECCGKCENEGEEKCEKCQHDSTCAKCAEKAAEAAE